MACSTKSTVIKLCDDPTALRKYRTVELIQTTMVDRCASLAARLMETINNTDYNIPVTVRTELRHEVQKTVRTMQLEPIHLDYCVHASTTLGPCESTDR